MTFGVLHREITRELQAAGCEDAAFDARCLTEDFGGVPAGQLPAWRDREIAPEREAAVRQAAARRCRREPLQYILGKWDFLTLTLEVGPGVLIPRPETEVLCRVAAEHLTAHGGRRVLDLCAGTGCVGLGIASLCPDVQVTAVEKYEAALAFLRRNLARYPQWDVRAVQADVLEPLPLAGPFDVIASNPPYIGRGELPGLQPEVRREPASALDGGEDGLVFYRALARYAWPLLAPGGLLAAEVGAGQAPAVRELFARQGARTETEKDFSGIERVVCAYRP